MINCAPRFKRLKKDLLLIFTNHKEDTVIAPSGVSNLLILTPELLEGERIFDDLFKGSTSTRLFLLG